MRARKNGKRSPRSPGLGTDRSDYILDVDKTVLPLGVIVSTIDSLNFLGYCETMVMGGEYDGYGMRCDDRDDARLMHDRVVKNLSAGLPPFGEDNGPL